MGVKALLLCGLRQHRGGCGTAAGSVGAQVLLLCGSVQHLSSALEGMDSF